jgi:hypothetical protein
VVAADEAIGTASAATARSKGTSSDVTTGDRITEVVSLLAAAAAFMSPEHSS